MKAAARRFGVSVASVLGSFVVYGAHVACGGGSFTPRVVPSAPAQTSSASAAAPTSVPTADVATANGSGCGCVTPKMSAYFTVSGDEKLVIDPLDAQASLDVTYTRGPGGKRQVVLTGVIRAYRSDVPAERPTTLAIRLAYPDGSTPPSSPKDLEAHLTTWGSGNVVAPHVYAVVAKSALAVTVTESALEIRGSLTLRDPAASRTITLEKLALRKSGSTLLPDRTGVFHP
jgi:hypothetical protein